MKKSCSFFFVILTALGSSAPLKAQAASPATPPATSIHQIAPGPYQPTWESLEAGYQVPDWFRNAKFGIWAHWTAQCVPEQGDWYARNMY